MEDESTFLLQVAEALRGRTVRTLVARRAYDQVADELTGLAQGATQQAATSTILDSSAAATGFRNGSGQAN